MKNINNKTLLFYYFQLDRNVEYNATTINTNGQAATIKDALQALPFDLSEGVFHFRFKSQIAEGEEKILSWIDINNIAAKVPMINGAIYMKILKLKTNDHNKLFNIEKLKKADIIKFGRQNIVAQNQQNNASKVTVNAVKGNNTPQNNGIGQNNKPNNQQNQAKNEDNNVQNQQRSTNGPNNQVPKAIPGPKIQVQPLNQNKNVNDGLDFISFNQQTVKAPPKSTSTTIEQNLQTYKQQFDDEQKHKQNQRQASIELQQNIKKWGYTNGKIINNTVTLIATLHTIWPEWEQVSLADMLKPEQVNSMFKKAVIKVHPDKNRNRDFKEKYLSKRVFELLNESRKV